MSNGWKGSTEIILTDIKTREEKIIKNDNVFKADNISSFCRNMGYMNGSIFNHDVVFNRSIWKTLIGGLLLFDNSIDENEFMMPGGVSMTGNGSYNVYNNGTPVELGSWNDTESSESDGQIVLVWDFTTSQANGKIECISLTSDTAGYIGMGNKSGNVKSSKRSIREHEYYSYSSGIPNNGSKKDITGMLCHNNGMVYSIVPTYQNGGGLYYSFYSPYTILNYGKLWYKKRPIYAETLDLCSNPRNNVFDKNIEVNLPTDGYQYAQYVATVGSVDTKMYIIGNPNHTGSYGYNAVIAPDASFDVYIVDFESDTAESKIVKTNITGEYIRSHYPGTSSDSAGPCVHYIGNDEYLMITSETANSSTYSLYHVDYKTNVATKIYTGISKDTNSFVPFGKNLVINRDRIIDVINKTSYPTNLEPSYFSSFGQGYGLCAYTEKDKIFEPFSSGSGSTGPWCFNPFYLATINNLSEPVYKTDSQTMKVIYTLTRQQS